MTLNASIHTRWKAAVVRIQYHDAFVALSLPILEGCVGEHGSGVNCYDIEGAFGVSCPHSTCVIGQLLYWCLPLNSPDNHRPNSDSCLPNYTLIMNPKGGGYVCVRKY
jgi:hypothetical protein